MDALTIDNVSHKIFNELASLYESIIGLDSEAAIYRCVARHLPRLIVADRASVALLRTDTDQLEVFGLNAEASTLKVGARLSLENSLAGRAVTGSIATAWRISEHLSTEDGAALNEHGFVSCMNAPLRTTNGISGTLNVASQKYMYSQSDLDILHQISTLVATSIERLNLNQNSLYASKRYKNYSTMLEHLNQLGASLASTMTVEESLEQLGLFANKLFVAKRLSFCELMPSGKDIRISALVGPSTDSVGQIIPLISSGLSIIFSGGKFTHFTDLTNSSSSVHRNLGKSGFQHLWSAPIYSGDKVVATLNYGTSEADFNVGDITSVLKTASSFLSLTVERIRFHDNNESSLRTLIDDNPTMLVVLKESGMIEQVSRFGANLLGYEAESLHDRPFIDIHPDSEKQELERRIRQWFSNANESVHVSEVLMTHQDKIPRWTRQTARLTTDNDKEKQVLVVCEDIHLIKSMSKKMEKQAKTDALTGLPNRYEFSARLDHMLAVAKRTHTDLSVMFIDIDRFKDINDSLGHQIGDEILREVATRLQMTLKATDIVARIGGDEFLVLLPGCGSVNDLVCSAQRILAVVNNPVMINNSVLKVTASIGVSRFLHDGISAEELIKRADASMYHAKQSGRNGYQLYSEKFQHEQNSRIALEGDLGNAIVNKELTLVFQPQFNLGTCQANSIEALLRWNHPTLGFVGPDVFIPLAENCGLIKELTDWVLNESIATLVRLHSENPMLRVAVNISATEFAYEGDLLNRIEAVLETYSLDPKFLELEITETALLENPEQATALVGRFYDMGVKVAIDDFGTGYSSLSYLVHLPISSIKIDRSFVQDIDNDSRKQAVVNGIIAISKSIGVGCIAEGVETEQELDKLQDFGCNWIQGYLLSRPVSEDMLAQALSVKAAA